MELKDISGTFDAETRQSTDQIKLAIIGPPKGGKSRLAATLASTSYPVLLYDFDDRWQSVAGTPGLHIKTLVDRNPMYPQAYDALYKDLGMFEYAVSKQESLPFKGIILDSITYMSNAAMSHVMNSMSSDKSVRTFSVGGYSMRVARGFDPYVAETDLIANTIIRCFGLCVDVICVFHERPEEQPDSTTENPKFTGRVTVHPPRMSKILPLFNEQWRIAPESGKYVVQTKPDYQFTGATCLMIDDREEPNIQAMIQKHKQRIQEKQKGKQ